MYPKYKNTFYVRSEVKHTGKQVNIIDGKRIESEYEVVSERIFGDGDTKLQQQILYALQEGTPLPDGVIVLDMDKSGIDPYEYLELPNTVEQFNNKPKRR